MCKKQSNTDVYFELQRLNIECETFKAKQEGFEIKFIAFLQQLQYAVKRRNLQL